MNATGDLTSTTIAKSITGMPASTLRWRAGWAAWKKIGVESSTEI